MDKIDEIVKILFDHGDELSDGYGYYCDDPDAKPKEIAEEILRVV